MKKHDLYEASPYQEGQDDELRGVKGCWCGADER